MLHPVDEELGPAAADTMGDELGTQQTGYVPVARPLAPLGPSSVQGRDLLIGVALIWVLELAIGTVIGVWSVFQGSGSDELASLVLPPGLLLGTTVLANAVAFTVAWYFVCRKYRKSLLQGFGVHMVPGRTLAASFLLGLVGCALAVVLLSRYSTEDSLMAELMSVPYGLLVINIMALTVPPVEEAYYRGFIFPVLRDKLGGWWAVLLVTVWFGCAHAFQLAGDWVGLGIVVAMGLLFTIQRHLTNSLLPPIITHCTYNTGLVLLGLGAELPE